MVISFPAPALKKSPGHLRAVRREDPGVSGAADDPGVGGG